MLRYFIFLLTILYFFWNSNILQGCLYSGVKQLNLNRNLFHLSTIINGLFQILFIFAFFLQILGSHKFLKNVWRSTVVIIPTISLQYTAIHITRTNLWITKEVSQEKTSEKIYFEIYFFHLNRLFRVFRRSTKLFASKKRFKTV